MNKLLIFLLFLSPALFAVTDSEIPLQHVSVNIKDQARLQRGAKMYMNYCSGCHSLKYMRYNRMAKDMGLTTFAGEVDKDLLYNNLIFTSAKIHDPIQIAMPAEDAREWFGVEPPDLSLVARKRGANWIFTYLKSFYIDESRPFGSNNLLVPGVAMPNILAPLEGRVIAVRKKDTDEHLQISHLLLIKPGRMTQHEFDNAITDLVNFLVYVGEPAQLIRYRIGVWVLLFLFVFFFAAYKLKKAYWRKLNLNAGGK
ncbi:cytochrome c1 [Legionella israelensis]|uniref:Cytochrome c1 n=1 Tax=Legionella israelensis TaxID=454 RepID=A0A0W0V2X5_9GAMM|nr:cytochrome c1 [Legionella israelensis]KTD14452.1 ubiquinol-cytochrome c reductase cytochrome c1 subunit [Legionella israelensis]QBR83289.1 cytochrome c1 [Legionella israelensis]QBS09334.1 cytochrome c1 [Legionella israelensis]SCX90086.1 ubiquinol-cytochrome c reductase cytochrome c1 subunit [Legionella israelensis DSM 19235]STX60233.1 ubiquinol-cytochrome c reductase cytochrome c1 subunit [Legionella israelensis]